MVQITGDLLKSSQPHPDNRPAQNKQLECSIAGEIKISLLSRPSTGFFTSRRCAKLKLFSCCAAQECSKRRYRCTDLRKVVCFQFLRCSGIHRSARGCWRILSAGKAMELSKHCQFSTYRQCMAADAGCGINSKYAFARLRGFVTLRPGQADFYRSVFQTGFRGHDLVARDLCGLPN
jgi:hypothetical protein